MSPTSFANQPSSANPKVSTLGDDEPLLHLGAEEAMVFDLIQAAEAYGITVEQVRSQMAIQDKMDTLDFTSLDAGYTEDGSTGLGPDFRLWYRSANPPSKELREALDDLGVAEFVDFQHAPYSFDELSRLAGEFEARIKDAGLPVQASLSTEIGGVTLHPEEVASELDVARAEQLALELDLAATTESLPSGMQIGGREADLDGSGTICTGGFVVVKNAQRSVLTAGHCADLPDTFHYGGNPGFNVVTKSFNAVSDVLNLDKNGVTWHPVSIFGEGGTRRDVTERRTWTEIDVGDGVAKWGRTSNYSFGDVVDKSACGAGACTSASRFIRVEATPTYGPNMCGPGDSGGPFMLGTIAYGILSARYADGDCTFMATSTITTHFDATVIIQ